MELVSLRHSDDFPTKALCELREGLQQAVAVRFSSLRVELRPEDVELRFDAKSPLDVPVFTLLIDVKITNQPELASTLDRRSEDLKHYIEGVIKDDDFPFGLRVELVTASWHQVRY